MTHNNNIAVSSAGLAVVVWFDVMHNNNIALPSVEGTYPWSDV